MSKSKRLLKIEDIQQIDRAEKFSDLFKKLGYDSCCSILNLQDLELSESSDEYIDRVYSIVDRQYIRVILFEINSQFWQVRKDINKGIKIISDNFSQRPAIFFLLFTCDYNKVFLVNFIKQFDREIELKPKITKTQIDLINPHQKNIGTLEKIQIENYNNFDRLLERVNVSCQRNNIFSNKEQKFHTDYLSLYLQQIAKFPRLKLQQEHYLCKKIKKYNELIQKKEQLEKELKKQLTIEQLSLLSNMNCYEIYQTMEEGKLSTNKLIEHHLYLVAKKIKKYSNSEIDLWDLIQAGNIGLIKAVQKFDYTKARNPKFCYYATWIIGHYIVSEFKNNSRIIKVPINIWDSMNKIKKIEREILKSGELVTKQKIAAYSNYDLVKINNIIRICQPIISLDGNLTDRDIKLIQSLESNGESLKVQLLKLDLADRICASLANLNEREKQVIINRFGLDENGKKTFQEIGNQLGLTKERIRQLEVVAKKKIQKSDTFKELAPKLVDRLSSKTLATYLRAKYKKYNTYELQKDLVW